MTAYAFIGAPATSSGATGTDAGYDYSVIQYSRQYDYWKSTTGGTMTCTVGSGDAQGYGVIGLLITAPNGSGMGVSGADTVTVRLYSYDGFSYVLEDTLSLTRWSPPGLLDRRIVFFDGESWANYIVKLEIDFPAQSEVSHICMLTTIIDADAVSQTGPMFRNITEYMQKEWSIKITPVGKMSDSGGSFFYAEDENLQSLRTFSGVIGPLQESAFRWDSFYLRKSYNEFMLIVPQVAQYYGDTNKMKHLMHMTAVFGRLAGNYSATYVATKADSGEEQFTIPIVVNEAG